MKFILPLVLVVLASGIYFAFNTSSGEPGEADLVEKLAQAREILIEEKLKLEDLRIQREGALRAMRKVDVLLNDSNFLALAGKLGTKIPTLGSGSDRQSVNTFLSSLGGFVGTLTPSNSGLSQELISSYQATVNDAQESLNTNNVSEADVQAQEEVVSQAESVVEGLESEVGTSTSGQESSGSQSSPSNPYGNGGAPIQITPGTPELIQGENQY